MRHRAARLAAPLLAATGAVQPATAQIVISGGGAAASAATIVREQSLFTAAHAGKISFSPYIATTSTAVQTAVINNDPTQLGLVAGSETIHFGSSEQPLSATQAAAWASVATGQAAAGNLIQIPAFGAGLAIPVVNSAISANGQLVLSDDQLCAVFSGKVSDWSQLSPNLTAGTITVVYRPESAGTSFQLAQHLAAVCSAQNSNFAQPMASVPSTTFANLFTGAKVPGNFKAVKGLANLAADMNTAETSAISYISPDWTTMAPFSDALLPSGQHSTLFVAALTGQGLVAILPSVDQIRLGLSNPGPAAINPAPPSNGPAAANPLNWLPRLPTVTRGYPIVSYTAFVLPQCFHDPKLATALKEFLINNYNNAADQAGQNANGQVRIAQTPATSFLRTVNANILANKSNWNVNIQNATACAALTGR